MEEVTAPTPLSIPKPSEGRVITCTIDELQVIFNECEDEFIHQFHEDLYWKKEPKCWTVHFTGKTWAEERMRRDKIAAMAPSDSRYTSAQLSILKRFESKASLFGIA